MGGLRDTRLVLVERFLRERWLACLWEYWASTGGFVLGRYWGSTIGVLGKQWAVLCGSTVGVRWNIVGGTGEVLG